MILVTGATGEFGKHVVRQTSLKQTELQLK